MQPCVLKQAKHEEALSGQTQNPAWIMFHLAFDLSLYYVFVYNKHGKKSLCVLLVQYIHGLGYLSFWHVSKFAWLSSKIDDV